MSEMAAGYYRPGILVLQDMIHPVLIGVDWIGFVCKEGRCCVCMA